jgi:uroporphyrinogen III methyltransferase/synthase
VTGPGRVALVGAGPGDPGLLTVRGAELLARADVVVHDRLSDPSLLGLAPPGAERVDVGKQPDDRGDQEAINELLVQRARAGRRVVRLKGGDPFVFGRGGEEALALEAAGIAYEVVPGVTSAVAAPAYAGVPVTHRGMVTSFTVAAGHTRSVERTRAEGGTDWEALAATGGTIVVLMGAAHRARIAQRLMAGGMPASTPVMAVQWGTEPYQVHARTTLGQLGSVPVEPPVTLVIGEVAALELSWYRSGPLAGRTVVVTRARHQSNEMASRLREMGARPMEVAAIEQVAPPDGGRALEAAVATLRPRPGAAGRGAPGYAWVVFASANAVERFFAVLPDVRWLGGTAVAAVGPATAAALADRGVVADLVPDDHSAEGLVECFPSFEGPPWTAAGPDRPLVLLPQATGARPRLREGLAARGWTVEAVDAYRTVEVDLARDVLASAGRADAILFASPTAVRSYVRQAAACGAPVPELVACIGPTTARAAAGAGLAVAAQAGEHTLDGLLAALAQALGPAN